MLNESPRANSFTNAVFMIMNNFLNADRLQPEMFLINLISKFMWVHMSKLWNLVCGSYSAEILY